MLEPKNRLPVGETVLTIGILLLVAITFSSCKGPQGVGSTQPQGSQANQASAFNGEVYRSQDGSVTITMTSPDELELAQSGVNLICKYTRQANAIRVVETVMGTSQAVYYQVIPEGIQGPDGRILYSPSALQKVLAAAELAKRQAEERDREQAEEQVREQQMLAERLQESHTPKAVIFNSAEPGVLNLFPMQVFFVTKTTISDVSVTFSGTDRIKDARFPQMPEAKRVTEPFEFSFWFGEVGEPSLQNTYRYNLPNGPLFKMDAPDQRPGQTGMHGDVDFYFQTPAMTESFVEAVAKARQSWGAKYQDLSQRR